MYDVRGLTGVGSLVFEQELENYMTSGRKRPTGTGVWTAQKGQHVTVSTKITKEEYERFSAVVKANKTNKNEVLQMFIRSYINNVK